ncbi:MAG: polysaccharide deacetylase family protein [bacterium]
MPPTLFDTWGSFTVLPSHRGNKTVGRKEAILRRLLFLIWLMGGGTAFAGPGPESAPLTLAAAKTIAPNTPFTVLCYHRFITRRLKTTSTYLVGVDQFQWQMQYLKDHGITPITVQQLMDFWNKGTPLPPKPVLLTFDDGFRSIYQKAFPVLEKFKYPGVLFLISSFVKVGEDWSKTPKAQARRLALNDAEIAQMQKAGLAVESHTVSHPLFAKDEEQMTPKKYLEKVRHELGYPVTFLQDQFGQKPELLAYPYGVYNAEVLKQTAELYQLAFTVNEGPNDRTVDPYKLRRDLVLGDTTKRQFESMFGDRVLHIAHALPGDGQVIQSRKPLISIQITDPIMAKSVVLRLESRRLKIHYDPKTRLVTYQVEDPIWRGGHQLTLRAKDTQGTVRMYSWYFRVQHLTQKARAVKTTAAVHPAGGGHEHS